MPITILPPAPPPQIDYDPYSDDDDEMELDFDDDVDMKTGKPAYKKPRTSAKHIITPGELVTDDTQWMRCVQLLRFNTKVLTKEQRAWNILPARVDRNTLLHIRHNTQDQ